MSFDYENLVLKIFSGFYNNAKNKGIEKLF